MSQDRLMRTCPTLDGVIQSESKDARGSQDREPIADDIIILYRTLVKDKALPPGYEKEFSSLGPILRDAADRQLRKNAAIENEQAAVLLHDFHRQKTKSSEATKSAVDQFVAAARDKPRSYHTRLQRMLDGGRPDAPKTEEMERARWMTRPRRHRWMLIDKHDGSKHFDHE